MARGKRTGGRKKGSKNKKKLELKKVIEKIAGNIENFKGQTPLEFLIAVYTNKETYLDDKGEEKPKISLSHKLTAAQAAAPFMHKKMPQETQLSTPKGGTATLIITGG